ncbi:putative DNA/RNA helicase SEN1 [Sugiyamaella lignohabitans]|uniref:Putative DNA/RNA helicase SEN1 n=1 Tax=Sugiyamaella lignohabitans TaxID=796027 RepID=A0A167CSC4_9ASCO|nr:putative DNA/RNA helicase SEN1 [Sugiyamaella lignohabitans]ANB12051.1 putative DNA/RNA helicase SEN1 [Sugiyamaella lignohabitans]
MAPTPTEIAQQAYEEALKLNQDWVENTSIQHLFLASVSSAKALLAQTKLAEQSHVEWCHWFCDEKWRPLAANALFVLSMDGSKQAIGLYDKLGLVVSKCASCGAFYHLEFEKTRIMLKQRLHIGDDKISIFERAVQAQDKDRLLSVFQDLSDWKKTFEQENVGVSIPIEKRASFFVPMVECLYCPWLFSPLNLACTSGDDDKLYTLFKEAFTLFEDAKVYDPVIIKTRHSFCLGAEVLFFSMEPKIHQLAKSVIMRFTCISVNSDKSPEVCVLYPNLTSNMVGLINDTALQVMEYMGPIKPGLAENPFSQLINVNNPSVLYLLNASYFVGMLYFCRNKNYLKIELKDVLDPSDNFLNLLRNCLSYTPSDESTGRFSMALSALNTLLLWKPVDLMYLTTKLAPLTFKDIAQSMLTQSNQLFSSGKARLISNLSSVAIFPSYDVTYEFGISDWYNWLNAIFKADLPGHGPRSQGQNGSQENSQGRSTSPVTASESATGDSSLASQPSQPSSALAVDENTKLNICNIILNVLDRHITSLPVQTEAAKRSSLIRRFLIVAISGLDFPKSVENGLPKISDVSRLMRATIRGIVDKGSRYILDSRSSRDLLPLVYQLIRQCLEFDIISSIGAAVTKASTPNVGDKSASNSARPSNGLWQAINRMPRLFDVDFTTNILKGLKLAAFTFESPTLANNSPIQPDVLNQAADSLRIISELDPVVIRKVFKDRDALVSVFLSSFSGSIELSDLAIDVICQTLDETSSRSEAFKQLLRDDPKLVVRSFNEAVDLVRSVGMFSPCAKLIKVSQDFVDALYSPHGGVVDGRFKADLTKDIEENELLQYWLKTWSFLQFTFKNTRNWGETYIMSTMKDFFREEAHYCQTLLDQFRLFEVDLPFEADPNISHGERLALPVASTIELMCDLLRLRDTQLLDACFRNIISIIELMKSFNVKLPESLVEVFKRCSSGKITNKLSQDNIAQLLAALNSMGVLSEAEIETIQMESQMRKKKSGSVSVTPAHTQSPPPGSGLTLANLPLRSGSTVKAPAISIKGVSSRQRTLLDMYQKTPDGRPPPVVIPPHSSSVQPSAPPRTSAMDLLRESVKQNRMSSTGAAMLAATSSKPPAKEIHPPRPPGFNSRRTVLPSSSASSTPAPSSLNSSDVSDQSDDESDDGLFTEKKAADTGPKMRNINRPGFRINTANMTRKGTPTVAQKQLEKRLMQQRLNIDMGPLHKEVLSWDYFARNDYFQKSKGQLKPVQSEFKSVEDYQSTFTPLLMLECWEGIQKVKEENVGRVPFKIQVGKRVKCDDFYDVYASVSMKEFQIIKLGESDLIVLSYHTNLEVKALMPQHNVPHCYARIQQINLHQDYADLILRTYEPGKMIGYLSQNCVICGLKASSPPGTGKTKTILAIAGAYLTSAIPALSQFDDDVPNTRRILVCAPSNAAVDELVLRFKSGIIGSHGKVFEPSVVRLGRSDAVNIQVRDVTLEELLDKMVEKNSDENGRQDDNSVREKQQAIIKERNELRRKIDNTQDISGEEYSKLSEEIRVLSKQIKDLSRQLDVQREQRTTAARMREAQRRKFQDQILRDAQVICCTLSGSSHKVLSSLKMRFDTVIIDEAAQSVELSALIPLRYGCTRCIMVGDPNQLPPTVLSQAASNLKYEQSLFVRMFEKFPERVYLLDTQFRMHPDISEFASREFYGGRLYNGDGMASLTARAWHSNPMLAPYKFFDVVGSQKKSIDTKSMYNTEEAEAAYALYEMLFKTCSENGIHDLAGKVGIISPYKRQVKELRFVFRAHLGEAASNQIDFNTIDGFQGQEKDVIILSCVRAQPDAQGVGFLGDTRRMNVAITRAKSSMWILGNENNLVKNPVWKRLIGDARQRNMFVKLRADVQESLQEQIIARATQQARAQIEQRTPDVQAQSVAREAHADNLAKRLAEDQIIKEEGDKKLKIDAAPAVTEEPVLSKKERKRLKNAEKKARKLKELELRQMNARDPRFRLYNVSDSSSPSDTSRFSSPSSLGDVDKHPPQRNSGPPVDGNIFNGTEKESTKEPKTSDSSKEELSTPNSIPNTPSSRDEFANKEFDAPPKTLSNNIRSGINDKTSNSKSVDSDGLHSSDSMALARDQVVNSKMDMSDRSDDVSNVKGPYIARLRVDTDSSTSDYGRNQELSNGGASSRQGQLPPNNEPEWLRPNVAERPYRPQTADEESRSRPSDDDRDPRQPRSRDNNESTRACPSDDKQPYRPHSSDNRDSYRPRPNDDREPYRSRSRDERDSYRPHSSEDYEHSRSRPRDDRSYNVQRSQADRDYRQGHQNERDYWSRNSDDRGSYRSHPEDDRGPHRPRHLDDREPNQPRPGNDRETYRPRPSFRPAPEREPYNPDSRKRFPTVPRKRNPPGDPFVRPRKKGPPPPK